MPLFVLPLLVGREGSVANQSPGGLATKPTVYLFTQDNCADCPAAKAVMNEAFNDRQDVQLKTIDIQNMDPDFEFKLLEQQVFIASTPSIMIENGGKLRLLYSGEVPRIESIREEVQRYA
ncbi:MAG: hypothetical protein ACXAAO_10530 [Candidatus Thorarchaeota archaeon]|jgi:glutaredoxin